MMDRELKRKWVEALRSGKYHQGRNVLRNSSGEYCCLGVLCEVALLDYEPINWSRNPIETRILPVEVQQKLTWMNDGQTRYGDDVGPSSFDEIADYIEANL